MIQSLRVAKWLAKVVVIGRKAEAMHDGDAQQVMLEIDGRLRQAGEMWCDPGWRHPPRESRKSFSQAK